MKRTTWVLLALMACAPMSTGALAQEDGASDLVAGNTAFALDLYAAVRQDAAGNLLFSPYSVSQALAMTYAGAGGETAAQMAETLAFRLQPPALHAAFGALNADLVARGTAADAPDGSETARGLRIANALWGEQTYPFSEEYNALLEQSYGAGLHQSDFIHAPEETRGQINEWVAEQTEDRIQDIVPEGAITPATRLVLANAIYFYGAWFDPFMPDATSDGEFFLLDGTTVTVPFMFQQEHLNYARGDGFQVIEFPYAGGPSGTSGFAFTVILPDEGSLRPSRRGWIARRSTRPSINSPTPRCWSTCRSSSSSTARSWDRRCRRWGWQTPSTRRVPTFRVWWRGCRPNRSGSATCCTRPSSAWTRTARKRRRQPSKWWSGPQRRWKSHPRSASIARSSSPSATRRRARCCSWGE
jgi:hypothetical protein